MVKDAATGRVRHLLVVDDDDRIRELLKAFLTRAGFRVSAAPGGEVARRLLQALDFDLAILDGEAVPAGGMGICKQLKDEIYRCPPVLVLTGRREDAWLATWSRADAVVPQPLDPWELAEVVSGLLRRRVAALPSA